MRVTYRISMGGASGPALEMTRAHRRNSMFAERFIVGRAGDPRSGISEIRHMRMANYVTDRISGEAESGEWFRGIA